MPEQKNACSRSLSLILFVIHCFVFLSFSFIFSVFPSFWLFGFSIGTTVMFLSSFSISERALLFKAREAIFEDNGCVYLLKNSGLIKLKKKEFPLLSSESQVGGHSRFPRNTSVKNKKNSLEIWRSKDLKLHNRPSFPR